MNAACYRPGQGSRLGFGEEEVDKEEEVGATAGALPGMWRWCCSRQWPSPSCSPSLSSPPSWLAPAAPPLPRTPMTPSNFMETLPFACGETLPVSETWSLVESWIDRPTSMCVGMGRFTILTLQTNISQVYITRLRRNRLFYAARHGYRYCELNATPDPLRPLAWGKVPALLMLLPRVTDGWVLFMDADAIITNHDVKLEKFLNLPGYSSVGKDLILTSDFDNPVFSVSPVTAAASINTGVFLIRNSKWSLSMLRSLYNDFPYRARVVIIPYRYMNCWLEIPYCESHEPSPFVVHAAGRDADKYRMLYLKFKEYPGESPDKIAWVSRVAISV
eukprot:jgi/Chlat1/3251/Chrsp22S03514